MPIQCVACLLGPENFPKRAAPRARTEIFSRLASGRNTSGRGESITIATEFDPSIEEPTDRRRVIETACLTETND